MRARQRGLAVKNSSLAKQQERGTRKATKIAVITNVRRSREPESNVISVMPGLREKKKTKRNNPRARLVKNEMEGGVARNPSHSLTALS